jgi:hypothetical protein
MEEGAVEKRYVKMVKWLHLNVDKYFEKMN